MKKAIIILLILLLPCFVLADEADRVDQEFFEDGSTIVGDFTLPDWEVVCPPLTEMSQDQLVRVAVLGWLYEKRHLQLTDDELEKIAKTLLPEYFHKEETK